MLNKLHSTVIGCEFSISESPIQYVQKKKEEIYQSINKATEEGAKITSIVCDEAMEKWLHLWIREMTTNKKSRMTSIVMRLKVRNL